MQRTVSVANPANQRITYGYDPTSNRTRLVTPDGGYFTYTWDQAGRIARLVNPYSEITTFGFDAIGRQSVQVLGNSTRASWTYDAANNITRLANIASGGATLSSFSYLVDPVGNRRRVVEASGDRVSWTYDASYQLRSEQRSGVNAYYVTHTWDPVGNRLVKIDGGVRTTATYNAANELVWTNDGTGRTTFTFDGSGNLSRQLSPAVARTSYSWDGENQLSKIILPSSVINTMIYNADGLRVEKDDSTGTTKSVWDGQNVLLDANASNITQALYTLQPKLFGNLLSQYRGSSSFYQFDALGSAIGLTNSLQSVTDSYLYKAFGDLLTSSGSTTNPYRFVGHTGYRFDPDSGKFYARQRNYDVAAARWLSPDLLLPVRPPNLYTYCANRPTKLIDPSGLFDGGVTPFVGEPDPFGGINPYQSPPLDPTVAASIAEKILFWCAIGGGVAVGIGDLEDFFAGRPFRPDVGRVICLGLAGCLFGGCVAAVLSLGITTVVGGVAAAALCAAMFVITCDICVDVFACSRPFFCPDIPGPQGVFD